MPGLATTSVQVANDENQILNDGMLVPEIIEMNELQTGETYSRIEINKMFGGGSIVDYMPIVKDAVVCVCIKEGMNQDARKTHPKVLVGKGASTVAAAQMLLKQCWTVPLFVKQRENEWEYMGHFRAVSEERDPARVAALGAASGRFDVVSVLALEP